MSMKTKMFAGAVSITLASSAAAAALLSGGVANAATSSCGHSCISLYTQQFGKADVLDSKGQGTATGTETIIFQESNSDPAEDWTVLGLPGSGGHVWHKGHGHAEAAVTDTSTYADTVADYYADDLVSSGLYAHYGNDVAFELEYTPYGVGTDECAGVSASSLSDGTKVSLQSCGASSKTLWVVDAANVQSYGWGHYVPLINGSDTNFDAPYVLTFPGGNPNDKPRPQLEVSQLLESSRHVVDDDQEWGVEFGVLR
jgi:hypothetical protein